MIKTIITLFAIYQSSLSSRLLLQQGPPELPVAPEVPATPVEPIAPPVDLPPVAVPLPEPAPEPLPVEPLPVEPLPVEPLPVEPLPVEPLPVEPTPVAPAPVAPVPAPVNPWETPNGAPPPLPAQPSDKLECKFAPPMAGNCALANGLFNPATGLFNPPPISVINPMENYEIKSDARWGMYASIVNIEITPAGYPIRALKGVFCTANSACEGGTFNIDNYGTRQVELDMIVCNKIDACKGCTFNLGAGVVFEQGDMFCGPGACDGCTINGESCNVYVEPI